MVRHLFFTFSINMIVKRRIEEVVQKHEPLLEHGFEQPKENSYETDQQPPATNRPGPSEEPGQRTLFSPTLFKARDFDPL